MKVKYAAILDRAIEDGVRRGYRRAHKHVEKPEEEAILGHIQDCVMGEIYEYFSFDDEV
jgi:hypothetical protein